MNFIHQFLKKNKIEPYERSCSQIMSKAEVKNNKNKENDLYTLPYNSKTHATLKDEIYILSLFFNN